MPYAPHTGAYATLCRYKRISSIRTLTVGIGVSPIQSPYRGVADYHRR